MPIQHIPTNIFMGFLGSGKTTAILNIFKQKPKDEYWAVLVNEFGKIGIDGKIYAAQDIAIEEVSGGCMCCTQGVPMRVSINRLLQRTKPDRLIIESSGVGHPSGLLKTLRSQDFENVLDIRAAIVLLDPERLLDFRLQKSVLFQDQLQCADILLANKIDNASDAALQAFENLKNDVPASVIAYTKFAQFDITYLDLPHNTCHITSKNPAKTIHKISSKINWQSESWEYPADVQFLYSCLERWIEKQHHLRIKGFVKTDQGDFLINADSGNAGFVQVDCLEKSYIEVIGSGWDKKLLSGEIKSCLENAKT